jgi:hypothetical protein
MNAPLSKALTSSESIVTNISKGSSIGVHPMILTDIYRSDVNIAVWQRSFGEGFSQEIKAFIDAQSKVSKSLTLSPENAFQVLNDATYGEAPKSLIEDMAQLIDMFCCLFDLKQAGLRLATLDNAMCPRFHVDNVPCRLVTTYQGAATEWLPNEHIDRSKLGHGSNGQPDALSGLYPLESNIEQLCCGDIALLKGSQWIDNEALGLAHRSPISLNNDTRLLLTLDFA